MRWGWIRAASLALLVGSACSDHRLMSGSDAARPIERDAQAADAQREGDPLQDRLEREADFWRQIEICATWAESYETVFEMAEQADAVVVARVVGASQGVSFAEPDVPENFYAEVNLEIEVDEVLEPEIDDRFALSMTLPLAFSPEDVEPALAEIREHLPADSMVLLVRAREDHDDLYRLISDKALWTRSARAELDNRAASTFCGGHYGPELRESFLSGIETVDELIAALRSSSAE